MLRGRYGQFNQAGDLAPTTGAQSTFLRAHLGALFVNPIPVVGQTFYHNYLGGAEMPGVHDVPLYRRDGYDGDLPSGMQPTAHRAPPWGV